MTGRIVKPSFRARGFHLENISDPIFNDLGMAPCLLQKSLWNKWIETFLITACIYMALYHLSSVNHRPHSPSTMISTSYTRGHHQRQGWLRWDWVAHQARTCSSPVPTYRYSSGEDFLGKLQFNVFFGHGRLQKLRTHLYIAIPSKPDTEARGPGQIWTQMTFLKSLFSNYWLIAAHPPLWCMQAGWSGLQKVSMGWRTLSP